MGHGFLALALIASIGCGDDPVKSGKGGQGGGSAGAGGRGGSTGAAGRGGTVGTGGTGGAQGVAGSGGSSGVAGTGGRGGTGGATAGTGGSAGAGGTGGSGGTGASGGRGGTGGATAGTGGSAGGSTSGTGGATGGTGGATAGTGGSATGGTGGMSCALPPTDGGVDGGGPLPDSVTFAANVTVATLTGGANAGATNGAPGVATFENPVSIAIGPSGAMAVSDYDNNLLRGVATDGTVSTLVQQSGFTLPFGLAYAGSTLYAHTDANPSGQRNATSGTIWSINTTSGLATVVAANVGRARGFGALSDGRLVLGDNFGQRVRLLDPTNGNVTDLAGQMGCTGASNGTGSTARFAFPYGVAVLAGDRIIVADQGAHMLREVTTAGVVTTFAGDGVSGTIDGPRATARFVTPRSLAASSSGVVFVSDPDAHRIRRIAVDGTVTTLAGDGTAGFMDGNGDVAKFFGQEGIAVSADGLTLFVADGTGGAEPPGPYRRIRKITIAP